MAATRLIPLHQRKGRSAARCLIDRVDYAKDPEKTEKGKTVTAYGCDPSTAAEEYLLQKRQYLQTAAWKPHITVISYVIWQSFLQGEVTAEEANRIGYELALRFTKGRFSFLVATHTDRPQIHNHIVFNSVSMDGSCMFRDFLKSNRALQQMSDLVCREHGVSVIEPESPSGAAWKKYPAPIPLRDRLCSTIDRALAERPGDYDMFLKELKSYGYEVRRGDGTEVRKIGRRNYILLSSLPEGYREDDIRAVLSGNVPALADAGEKMEEDGNGPQPKRPKLKQTSRDILCLRDHKVRDIVHLSSLIEEKSSARDDSLSAVKAAETRLGEISELKRLVTDFTRTWEAWETYRRGGYDPKYLELHREALTVHKAAKEALDRRRIGQLPRITDLDAERAELTALRKADYDAYRKLREETRELLSARRCLETLMETDREDRQRVLMER